MTNSIASAKCPSVLSSGNYGMSQNRYTDESKEYIFVKLTDSAYRAVEEYQRNENAKRFANSGQCAQIQFIGNSGVIHFPTPDSGEGRKFGFAIDDVEGSLECIQQQQHDLDVLGSVPYRMRIHANEDVYDTTRTKMAIAEETEKSKCIREIKPNQTDIGRKVKKPVTSTSFNHNAGNSGNNNNNNNNSSNNNSSSSSSFLSNSNSRKLVSLSNSPPLNGSNSSGGIGGGVSVQVPPKLGTSSSSRSPNPTMLGGSGTIGSGSNSSNSNRYGSHTSSANLYSQNIASTLPTLTSASSLSSTLAGGITNGYASASSGGSPPESVPTGKSKLGSGANTHFLGSGSNVRGGGSISGSKGSLVGSGGGKGSGSSSGSNKQLPDISRRKIRERLIHLLALKPFKKPELYSRLQNEGIRDRERSLIGNILKDISTLSRDNTYNLRRQMWNDVNENWPYYTEQELQQLKRRKPQNLTPPLSSDAGSSTSGQSPTSTHTGSPPPLVGSGGGLKRASLEGARYDESLLSGGQVKKQRISHFKKDAPVMPASGNLVAPRIGYSNANNGSNSVTPSNKNSSYSPHGGGGVHSTQVADENSGNSDLSYNLLKNADEFMLSHAEQSSSYGGGTSSTSSNSGRKSSSGNKNAGNVKEKRSSGVSSSSISSSNYGTQERTSSKELMKKGSSVSSTSASPTPYGSSFVPESKSSSSRSGGSSSANSNSQRQSPSYLQQQQQHHKTNNSVIFSPKTQAQSSSPHEEPNSTNRSSGSGRYPPAARSSSKSARTPTPPIQQPAQQQKQQHHSQNYHQQQQQPPSSQPPLQQQHSSPTQQIADAATSYATTSSSEMPRYDFSNYTPITTIEQRRRYKTEFESDYDEYRKLLTQIESVGIRFRGLAERLENARQGCSDYYNIKQQIVSEYERIRNQETLKSDKKRFDYLHEKLAHIKQLVTDYDKTLTSGAAAAAAAAVQQQQQLLQQQQQQPPQQRTHSEVTEANILASRNARLSPMVSGESNHSPPTSHHQHQQQQQQQHSHYQQHHDAETIQQHQLSTQLPTQSPPSNNNNNTAQQHYNGHHAPHAIVNSNNNTNNDSDSDDSSDSNSNNDDDDDSNSNSDDDDDNDNDHY